MMSHQSESKPELPTEEWHLLCLSPHFDDAVFSAGGILHRAARRGRRALVVTVCAGAPADDELSPFAALHHQRWAGARAQAQALDFGTPTAAVIVAARRAEDEAALTALGVEGMWLDVPDAIYRRAPDGHWPYATDASLFGPPHPSETALVATIAERLSTIAGVTDRTQVIAPLAIGGHVDHRIVRAAAESWRGPRLRYFEDWPYAGVPVAVANVVDEQALRAIAVQLAPADLDAKIEAMALYTSQISTFWPDLVAMAAETKAHALKLGATHAAAARDANAVDALPPVAERLWRRWQDDRAIAMTGSGSQSMLDGSDGAAQ